MAIKATLPNGEKRMFHTPEEAAVFAKAQPPYTSMAEAIEVQTAVEKVSKLIAEDNINPGLDIRVDDKGFPYHQLTPPMAKKEGMVNLLNPEYSNLLRTEDDWAKALSKWDTIPLESKLSFLDNEAFKKYPGFANIMMNPNFDNAERKKRILPILRLINNDLKALRNENIKKREELLLKQMELEALDKLIAWTELPMKLEKNDCSRLHKFIEAKNNRRLVHSVDQDTGAFTRLKGLDFDQDKDWDKLNTFVVQHDWASAFQNASDYAEGSAYNLPYPECCFEFRMTGMNILILAGQVQEQPTPDFVEFVDCGSYWIANTKIEAHPSFILAVAQIKAICVALEAECATHEVTRAPDKLNKKREKDGKVPLYSYHVVSLARRSRVSNPLSVSVDTGRKNRLHFRRGHWRHYPSHRTWIKWMLVGDPDLGFVDKEYRL